MPRGALTFKQRDLTAAVKAVIAAGREVERAEIDKEGKIVLIMIRKDGAEPLTDPEKNEWDDA